MKKYVKIYFDYFGYDTSDFIPCEVCGTKAVDIHHLDNKKMGGSKIKDYIENLIALCRKHHEDCHNSKEFNNECKELHKNNLKKIKLFYSN